MTLRGCLCEFVTRGVDDFIGVYVYDGDKDGDDGWGKKSINR